jgi:superfamily II RNA helicase
VTVKGRLAASLSCGDELVLAELVFGGAFNGLSLEALAAACSTFVYREKGSSAPGAGPKVQRDACRERAARLQSESSVIVMAGPPQGVVVLPSCCLLSAYWQRLASWFTTLPVWSQLRDELASALSSVRDAAKRVAKVELESKMTLEGCGGGEKEVLELGSLGSSAQAMHATQETVQQACGTSPATSGQ